MTANLILERSQCLPLERQDEDMAFELLVSECVFGFESMRELIDATRRSSSIFRSLRTSAPRCSSTPPDAACRRRCFRVSSTGRHASRARAPGATCSGRDATTPALSRVSRTCAPRCALHPFRPEV